MTVPATTPTGLARKLVEVSKQLDWVKKRGENKNQGYNYTMAEDIVAEVRAPLFEAGVAFAYDTTHLETVPYKKGENQWFLTIVEGRASFIDVESGEVITSSAIGTGTDNGDKSAYKAETGALKYCLRQAFLLPMGDDPEADAHDTTVKPAEKKASSPIPPTTRDTSKPEKVETAEGKINEKQIALLKVKLRERGVTITDAQRYILNKVVGKQSSKQLTSDDLDKVLTALGDDDLVLEAMASVSK